MEEEKGKSRKRSRLVLVPCPFQGHINPMLQLGTILHSRGFSITIVHLEFNSPDPSKHPDFEFMCFSDGLTHSTTGDLVAFLMLVNDNCKAPFQECFDQLTGKCKDDNADDKISGIIYDEFMYFAEAVAHQRKLPSIVLCTTSATFFIFRDVFPWLEGEGKTAIQGKYFLFVSSGKICSLI